MRLSDFDFELPTQQIAQHPAERREASRLMAIDRKSGRVTHGVFSAIATLLRRGDLLVLNDTRVVPARLLGHKEETRGKVELLIVRPSSADFAGAALGKSSFDSEWVCLGQASKGLKVGVKLRFPLGLSAVVTEARGGGEYVVRFRADQELTFKECLERSGKLPLPPYIERDPTQADLERYQTVYAKNDGSIAAPTAGLHFTPTLFDMLEALGVERASLTLEVGPGTFLPVRDDDVSKHVMHVERYQVPVETAEAIGRAKRTKRRVIAVGTTVVRTLESATDASGALQAGPGESALFIKPGFQFRQVDALLTNFHLPKSTLLMLVSAFLGTAQTKEAYREAVALGYRFFSYGDAMFISE